MKKLLIALAVFAAALIALEVFFPATASRLAISLERTRAGLTRLTASTGEFEFSYLQGGRGETLLLVHGFGADKDNFTRVAGHLTDRFHVIAIDLPGFGESTRLVDASYRIPDQAKSLHAIVGQLELERFHLGGSSMGGAIAIEYTATHPERVRSLWLLAPGGVAGAKDSEVAADYRQHHRSLLIVEDARDFGKILALTMEKKPFLPSSLKRTLGRRAARDYPLHKRIFDEIAPWTRSAERAQQIQAPALIVWGAEDRVLDPSGGPILHTAMAGSVLNIMPGVGHLPMIESPRQTAQDFIAFVDGLSR